MTLDSLCDFKKGTLHLDHNHIKYLSDLPALFDFIEKNYIQTFSIQGSEGYLYTGITVPLFHALVQQLKVNKTLVELNLHIFRGIVKSGGYDYMLTDLLSVHPTLQRIYLSRYDQFGAYSHVILK